jgi:hypothetical protein
MGAQVTILHKPLSRIVEVGGQEIVVTICPADAGIMAHIKLRVKGQHKSYKAIYIEAPAVTP